MVSTFTPNIQLEEPARGDQVGVWDTPVNGNMTLLDLVAGAITTISLNNSPVVLSAAQFKSRAITFNSTLTGSCAITFPTSFTKSYQIRNTCTGSSAFVVTLGTTAAGGKVVCCPPGESVDVVNSGTDLYFHNLERVGSYWDYGGSSVPAWVSGCTVPPYLNCDGSAFSAATYPALAIILGSTTLPDSKGSLRATLNQGSGRITSSQGGVDGNTLAARGGAQTVTLSASQIPNITIASSVATIVFAPGGLANFAPQGGGGTFFEAGNGSGSLTTGSLTMTSNNTSGGSHSIMDPTYIGGITMIRAA